MSSPEVKPKALRVLEQAAWSHVRLGLLERGLSLDQAGRYKTLRGFFASARGLKYKQECQRLHDQFWQRVLVAYRSQNQPKETVGG